MADKKTLRKRPRDDDDDDIEAKVPKIDNSSKKLQPSISKNKQLIKCWGWGRCDTMLDPTSPKFKEFTCECKDTNNGNIKYTNNVLSQNISRHFCDKCWSLKTNQYEYDSDDYHNKRQKRRTIGAKCKQCYKYYFLNKKKAIKEYIQEAIEEQRTKCYQCKILLDPYSNNFFKNRCSCQVKARSFKHKHFCDECWSQYSIVKVHPNNLENRGDGEMESDYRGLLCTR